MSGYGSLRTRAQEAADQRTAQDAMAGRDLMCSAQNCPHKWSVDAGSGRLCSFHAWSEPHLWPRITQERLDAMADRALRAQSEEPKPAPRSMSKAEKIQTLRGLSEASAPKRGKREWAFRIVERAKSGERVSPLVLRIAQAVAGKRKESA